MSQKLLLPIGIPILIAMTSLIKETVINKEALDDQGSEGWADPKELKFANLGGPDC